MANIWPVYDGREPTIGGPWASLPVGEAVALLNLREKDFVSGPTSTPRFGPDDVDLRISGYKHVVLEVKTREARGTGWKAGFYRSPLSPYQVAERLFARAVGKVLGPQNVVRVAIEDSTDSTGGDALRFRVVIPAGAAEQLAEGNLPLDALVALREQLSQMRDDRTPIVEFTTEADLLDVGT